MYILYLWLNLDYIGFLATVISDSGHNSPCYSAATVAKSRLYWLFSHIISFFCRKECKPCIKSCFYIIFALFAERVKGDIGHIRQAAVSSFAKKQISYTLQNPSRICLHSVNNRSLLHAAFAGLVEGRHTAGRSVTESIYF